MKQEIRILTKEESKNLETVAKIIEAVKGMKHVVKDIYFDCGQNWKFTTIVGEHEGYQYQMLNPKQWEEVLNLNSENECLQWVNELINN